MGELRTLAATRGAAGVEDGGQRVGGQRSDGVLTPMRGGGVDQAALAVCPERDEVLHTQAGGQCAQFLGPGRVGDEDAWLGIFNEVGQFGRLVGGVERHVHHARAQARKIENERGHRFFDLHHGAVAALHADALQPPRHAGRLLVEVGKGVAFARVGLDRGALQVRGKGFVEQGIEIV